MKNGKTLVAAAVAATLAAPASHAAIDDAGMQYTSAAEGFYGSLRMKFETSDSKTGSAKKSSRTLKDSTSRLGVRGNVDLGGGLSASYNYEFGVTGDNNADIGKTRLHNLGLSGGFGSLLAGSQWALDYNYVWVNTDVMNFKSGSFYYNANLAARQNNAITYTSPDFNGFSFGISAVMDGETPTARAKAGDTKAGKEEINDAGDFLEYGDISRDVKLGDGATDADADAVLEASAELLEEGLFDTLPFDDAEGLDEKEAKTIDKVVLAARYSMRGFNVAGTYVRRAVPRVLYEVEAVDGDATADLTAATTIAARWTSRAESANLDTIGLALGYGQDNWSLNYVYGKTDFDTAFNYEEKIHSVAGQLQVGKTTLRALYEKQDRDIDDFSDGETDTYTLSAQYDLGSKSRVWVEYAQTDNEIKDSDPDSNTDTDTFNVGYRVDF